MRVATHNGPFHADDVMAFALIRTFVDPKAEVVRTRDAEVIAGAEIAIDVGAVYDPARGRFDHHQASYQGDLSSAGMVLAWLTQAGHIEPAFATSLRTGLMDYLDAVDNGRTAPDPTVPCFPRIVHALNNVPSHSALGRKPSDDANAFDTAFGTAAAMAEAWLQGLAAEHAQVAQTRSVVAAAMAAALAEGRAVLFLDVYLPWKAAYFGNDGENHPTDYVLHPGTDGSWRIVAIPPKLGDFGQKRPLPEPWAGLVDEALEAVCGVPGAVFCHKNRFIAVFKTRDSAMAALTAHGLLRR